MNKSILSQKALCLSAAWSLAALINPTAHAATWDGETDTNYNEATNWSDNNVPAGGNSPTMSGAGGGITDLSGGIDVPTTNASISEELMFSISITRAAP